MSKDQVAVSKFLSFVLRHEPESIGLRLDANGWAEVDELVRLANESGRALTRDAIADIVAGSDKQRFTFDPSGQKIRANQGHSLDVDLELRPSQPPAVLYHGTAQRFIESIRGQGLQKRERHHVHLSQDEGVAVSVGKRHGSPVVLIIRAREMWQSGRVFYLSKNGVWLTDSVPVEFIGFPQ